MIDPDDVIEEEAIIQELKNAQEEEIEEEHEEISPMAILHIGLSEHGLVVSCDSDDKLLVVTLLSGILDGDFTDEILEQLPEYKSFFPSWGDEEPLIYPDQTMWGDANE